MAVRQGCVMSPWLFITCMDDSMTVMKARLKNLGATKDLRYTEQSLVRGLFADNNVVGRKSKAIAEDCR